MLIVNVTESTTTWVDMGLEIPVRDYLDQDVRRSVLIMDGAIPRAEEP